MAAQAVKNMLSREVLSHIKDYSTAAILRGIIFSDKTQIDWDEALEIIFAFMPELKQYSGYYGLKSNIQNDREV